MITVALVDRDPLVRRLIRMRLAAEADLEVVAEAPNASKGVALIGSKRPDMVLIAPPDPAGGETIGAILSASPQTRVIVLAVRPDEEAQMRALRAGASGWLLKSIDPEVLPRVLRGVRAGEAAVTRAFARRILDEVITVGGAGPTRLRPVRSPLTQREWEVADVLVEGTTTTEIARRLGVTPATVRTHIKHILGKVGAHSRDEAIRRIERWREVPRA